MDIFLKVLDPEDTSTGGGSAAAISGAMAGALLAMVSRLSSPGDEGADSAFFAGVYAQAVEVSAQLREGSQADSLAFLAVRAAYQLARKTEEEKAARQLAVQSAWLRATQTPLENGECCLRVLEMGAEMVGRINPRVASDYTCALLLARAGLLGCLENVEINLPSIKDAALVELLSARASKLRERCERLSDELLVPGEKKQ
jgi:formiminotetrahydrofolate cyclodeaminase